MNELTVFPYSSSDAAAWDTFVQTTPPSTLLHTRRFLSYHGNCFKDLSLLVRDENGSIRAVFPAALSPSDENTVVSHPGVTYGGILGGDKCRGEIMLKVMQDICQYYKRNGLSKLQYKAVPFFYHTLSVQDDLYALFRLGALRYRCDLSATIDLRHRGRVGSRRKRGYKKAVKSGVEVVSGAQYASEIWDVLYSNLQDKYDTKPVHSLEEILLLHGRFPDQIQFVAALCKGKVVAGVVLFQAPMVTHSQYIASSEIGYAVSALDMVFEYCIAESTAQGKCYFDFGISNENGGTVLNEGLYAFKSEFGAGGTVHEFYELDLGDIDDT